jgi:hypothetical protein
MSSQGDDEPAIRLNCGTVVILFIAGVASLIYALVAIGGEPEARHDGYVHLFGIAALGGGLLGLVLAGVRIVADQKDTPARRQERLRRIEDSKKWGYILGPIGLTLYMFGGGSLPVMLFAGLGAALLVYVVIVAIYEFFAS